MQDQHVRRLCHAVAAQLLLSSVPPTSHTRSSETTSLSQPANAGNTKTDPHLTSSEGSRADELRRVCEAVVRDAMTLYRLCHRPGGVGTVIVPGSSSSGAGGGGGVAGAAEEAAFCVCAAVMAGEPKLWQSVVRRAQLLRPRKPTLTFAAPVIVAPIVVAEVVKFFGRSRHLVAGVSQKATAAAAAPAPTSAEPGDAGVLSAQQAEAVAASFFFKTLPAAERQRRPEIFEIQTSSSSLSTGANVEKTTAATLKRGGGATPASFANFAPPLSSVGKGAEGQPKQAAAGLSAPPSPPPSSSSPAAALKGGTGQASTTGVILPMQSTRRPRPSYTSALLSSAHTALHAADDWAGWGSNSSNRNTRQRLLHPSFGGATESGQSDAVKMAKRGRDNAWLTNGDFGSSSSSSGTCSSDSASSDSDDGRASGDEVGDRTAAGRKGGREGGADFAGDKAARRIHHHGSADASAESVKRRRHQRAQEAAEAAVMEKLYRLATAADDDMDKAEDGLAAQPDGDGTAARAGKDGDAMTGGGGNVDEWGRRARHVAFSASSAAASPSSSLFTSGKGLGLVPLAAMTAQVQDEWLWGRLTALVRFPLLFRGLAINPSLLPSSSSFCTVPSAGAALSATSDALSPESMARMHNALGSSYTSTLLPELPTPQSNTIPLTADDDVRASLTDFVRHFGNAGSFFSPARVRASSLLPRPPSLVTDTFLWTRLLICATWLKVYADGLLEEEAGDRDTASSKTSSESDASADAAPAAPRIRSSPAVKELVTYCVAVVTEARAISAGVLQQNGENASASSRRGGYTVSGAEVDTRAVCCPVCDRLIKEQQPVLWWSTLREDRAVLREQVRTLLESGCTTDAEARVSSVVAEDAVRVGRNGGGGGRAFTLPLLSGSGAAAVQIASMQERWADYIMTPAARSSTAAEEGQGEHGSTYLTFGETIADRPENAAADCACVSEVHNPASETAVDAGKNTTQQPSDTSDDGDMEARETLWAALAQRVAAAVDLCTFLSTHPMSATGAAAKGTLRATPSSSLYEATAYGGGGVAGTTTTTMSTGGLGRGNRKRKRARRSTSSDESDESSSRSSTSNEDEAEDRARRRRVNRSESDAVSDADEETSEDDDEPAQRRRRRTGKHEHASSRHQPELHRGLGGSAATGWPTAAAEASRVDARGPSKLQGSRHAHEIAAEWEALLRRCGWVNAAPPPPPPSPSSTAHLNAQRGVPPSSSPRPMEDNTASFTTASAGYAAWAQSLLAPSAVPTASQAAVLRRRLSRYRLDDVVRILVLGRGGLWLPCARLLYGGDVVASQTHNGARTMHRSVATTERRTVLPSVVASSQSRVQRETSMSLLNDDQPSNNETTAPSHADKAEEQESQTSKGSGAVTAHKRAVSPDLLTDASAHSAPPPPPAASQLSPALLDTPSETSNSAAASLLEHTAATPNRKSALPSIPLHISPRTRQAAAAAAEDAAAGKTQSASINQIHETACGQSSSTDRRKQVSGKSSEGISSQNTVGGATPNCVPMRKSQLQAQQAALRALLHFHPRFPPLREEDGVLECGSCFSLFHQDCIAPVQRDLMGQVFLCHTCRLKWARPYVQRGADGGFIYQMPEPSQ